MVPVAGRAIVTIGMGAVAVAARIPGQRQEVEAADVRVHSDVAGVRLRRRLVISDTVTMLAV